MRTTVNGTERELTDDASLADLIAELALDSGGIAVAVNDAVVARSRYADVILRDGDRIELIHAVAGG